MNKIYPTATHLYKTANGELAEMYDLTAAEEYGTLQLPLFDHVLLQRDLAASIAGARWRMRAFDKHDYLLLVGDPLAIVLASIFAAYATGGDFHILKWNRRYAAYDKIFININDMEGNGNEQRGTVDVGGGKRLENVRRHFGISRIIGK